jgi:hypothetical protein
LEDRITGWSSSESTRSEFWFEHDIDRVRQATKDRGIDHPVAIDNHYESGTPSMAGLNNRLQRLLAGTGCVEGIDRCLSVKINYVEGQAPFSVWDLGACSKSPSSPYYLKLGVGVMQSGPPATGPSSEALTG